VDKILVITRQRVIQKRSVYMKNTIKVLGIIALVAVIMFSVAACNRGGGSAGAAGQANTGSLLSLDDILNEYEKLIDEYVPMLQRAMAGDTDALMEIEVLGAKFDFLVDEIEKFSEADYTPEQEQRLEEFLARQMSILGL